MINLQLTEKRYHPTKEPVYIVGQKWSFEWYPHEMEQVVHAYNAGTPISDIAREVDRSEWDVMMLLWDMLEHRQIEERRGGIWGTSITGGQ